MPTLIEHEIEGSLQHTDNLDFSKQKLVVHAIVQGSEVAKADVDGSGHYKINFQHSEEKPMTELRVTPLMGPESVANVAAAEIVSPTSFVTEGNHTLAHQDLKISIGPQPFPAKIYSMFGQVFARTGHTIEPLPGAKLEFEAFIPIFVLTPGAPPSWQRIDLGNCLTGPDGKYVKNFLINLPFYPSGLHVKGRPYLHVQISQLVMGVEYKLLSETLALADMGHDDFLVEVSKSTVCFTFQSLPLGLTTNPLTIANAKLTAFDGQGQLFANNTVEIQQQLRGMRCGHRLVIDLPFPSSRIQMTVSGIEPSTAQAFDVGGALVATQNVKPTNQPDTFQISTPIGIKQIVLTSGSKGWLFDLCY